MYKVHGEGKRERGREGGKVGSRYIQKVQLGQCFSILPSAKNKLSLINADSTEMALKRCLISEARKLPCYFASFFPIQQCDQEEQCTSVGLGQQGVVLVSRHVDKQGEYLKPLQMIQ